MSRVPWVLLLVVLAAACGQPAAVGPPTPLPVQGGCHLDGDPRALCVIALGDSLAAGVPLTGEDRWWRQLEGMLADALPGRPVAVDSWGVSGSRVEVLESAATEQPALDSYDIAIVIEGVNDVGPLTLDQWAPRYEAAVAAVESHGLRVLLATPPPSFEDGSFKTRYDALADRIRQIAGSQHQLIDIASEWHEAGAQVAATYYADLIHQGDLGQRRMAEMARDAVLALAGS